MLAAEEPLKTGVDPSQLVSGGQWKERNLRCFEGKGTNSQKIRVQCLSLLYFWNKHDMVGNTVDIVDFIGNL